MTNDKPQAQPELLPCPFCGGDAEYTYTRILGDHSVECKQCTAMVCAKPLKEQAIEAWNKRTGEK